MTSIDFKACSLYNRCALSSDVTRTQVYGHTAWRLTPVNGVYYFLLMAILSYILHRFRHFDQKTLHYCVNAFVNSLASIL